MNQRRLTQSITINRTSKTKQPYISDRIIFVDLLNILACLAVIGLHVSLNVFTPQHNADWLQAEILQGICVFSVPIFYMISGMNLFNYHERYNLKTFFIHRVLRVGQALIIGSAVCYLLYNIWPSSFYGSDIFNNFSLIDFVKKFLINGINDTYWFFYIIIGIYMLVPILTWCAKEKQIVEYIILVSFFISVAIPFIEWLGIPNQAFNSLFNWPTFSMALLYFTSGWWMHKWQPLKKINLHALVAIFITSSALMIVLGMYINGWWNTSGMLATYDRTLIIFNSPLCVLQSICLFEIGQKSESRLQQLTPLIKKTVKKLSSLSLGIYLLQIPIINWLGAHPLPQILSPQPVRLVFVYTVAALVVWSVKSSIQIIKSKIHKLLTESINYEK